MEPQTTDEIRNWIRESLFIPGSRVGLEARCELADAIELCKTYLAPDRGNTTFAALFGSTITGRNHDWSDLDLLIITASTRSPYREQVVVDGRMIQSITMSLPALFARLEASAAKAHAFIPVMLCTSHLVDGDKQLYTAAVTQARAILKRARQGAGAEVNPTLTKIANAIVAFAGCSSERDYFPAVERLNNELIELHLRESGIGGGEGKIKMVMFREILGSDAAAYDMSYRHAVLKRNPLPLMQLALRVISNRGVKSWATEKPVPM